MTRAVGYHWHLRELMAKAGMFSTTALQPHLAERGIELSVSQVHRLVTGTPERLSLPVLAALCDILDCQPGDLIEPYVAARSATARKAAGQRANPSSPRDRNLRPTRARIVDWDQK
ncbi:helix-turn-helix domain-containing protein [Amycolatopsis palatopharyngis]|uniref:helix-turn-helix domain-containing protein n=1 Tax=Amycolatopsis palatopharyngis TaxID=187982 RepID=UPI000E26A473|nr:helix-turn-helix transcriptional regulator [Amycolatopsis palatopharyngis]